MATVVKGARERESFLQGAKYRQAVWDCPSSGLPGLGALTWKEQSEGATRNILMNSWKIDLEWAVKRSKKYLATPLTFQAG